ARAQCANNMKEIGQALHSYLDTFKYWPPDYEWRQYHYGYGWLYSILPYIEHDDLYKQFRSPDPGLKHKVPGTILPNYLCPSDPRENAGDVYYDDHTAPPLAFTCYLGIVGKSSEWPPNSPGVNWSPASSFDGAFGFQA